MYDRLEATITHSSGRHGTFYDGSGPQVMYCHEHRAGKSTLRLLLESEN